MTSRTDLLVWLNELLQIDYAKVEQCGSGGAYCQVLDSIYGAFLFFSLFLSFLFFPFLFFCFLGDRVLTSLMSSALCR